MRAAGPYQAFLDRAPYLSRATTFRRAPNWSSEKAHLVNTIFNKPNHHRVSTNRLNREDSQSVASLEGEFSPTPSPKRPSHTHIPKPGFGGRGQRKDGVERRKSGSTVYRATSGRLVSWGSGKRGRWRQRCGLTRLRSVSRGLWPRGGKKTKTWLNIARRRQSKRP